MQQGERQQRQTSSFSLHGRTRCQQQSWGTRYKYQQNYNQSNYSPINKYEVGSAIQGEDNLSQAAKKWSNVSNKEDQNKDWCSRAHSELQLILKQLKDIHDSTEVVVEKDKVASFVRKVRARLNEVKQKYRLDGPDKMWVGQTDQEYLVVIMELAKDILKFTKEVLQQQNTDDFQVC
eukprot:TRINITY_DN2452_c0_g1_i1.p3 TRINITY_DN2452_c0_g1~~TRINITY_DN2452_c0_g1_i1.p3  ORF type:complete len:177 (-),score=16.43 TRINITY_DN2452_c0_g1_i1:262-792(-)